MKQFYLSLVCASLLAAPLLATAPKPVAFESFAYTGSDAVFDAPLPSGHYRNPILAGFYPDPSICRVGDDFYLINSTFAYFPGIPIFHSRDLVNWTQLGHVIDRPTQLNFEKLGVSRGIFAPAISHHDGIFYVVCTMADAGGNFVVTATDPAGPWSDPIWLGFDGIDPSLFFDDDGRAWLVNNGGPPDDKPLYQGHRAIWQQEFDVAAKKLVGPRRIIVNGGIDISAKPVWIEGPHLYKRAGWYYLCCAEGGTGEFHSQVILRSRSVTGPFVPWEKNPILTQRDLDGTVPHAVTTTGHADLVVGPDGNWWSVFLACRPYGGRFYATGRETFLLPVTWTDDGWPSILPPGQRVPYSVAAPRPAEGKTAPTTSRHEGVAVPLTGNFTWRDDFTAGELSPLWITLRAPTPSPAGVSGGKLLLRPSTDSLSGTGNPALLGRRLQHSRFETTTTLVVPSEAGVSAGLVAFQNETHHYYFGVRRSAEGLSIFVERLNGKTPETIAHATIAETPHLQLQLRGREALLSFAFSAEGEPWKTLLADADATVITTQAAGGFVGAIVGLHARCE